MDSRIMRTKAFIFILIIVSLVFVNFGVVQAKARKVERCFECHEAETKEWKKGPHANTLSDLEEGKQVEGECLECHSSDYELSSEQDKLKPKEAQHGVNCLSCHPAGLKKTKENNFKHVEDYNPLRRPAEKLCINCHSAKLEGRVAKLGEDINHSQQNIFYGYGGIGVEEQPSEKTKAGLTCSDCHMLSKETGAGRAHNYQTVLPGEGEPNSCINGGCHENFSNSMLTGMIGRWQSEIKGLLADVKQELDAKKKYKDTKPYKEAQINYKLVKEDKSNGVHNIYYARNLLWEAKDRLEIIEEEHMKDQK